MPTEYPPYQNERQGKAYDYRDGVAHPDVVGEDYGQSGMIVRPGKFLMDPKREM